MGLELLLANHGFAAMSRRLSSEGMRLTEQDHDALIRRLVVVDDESILNRLGIRRSGAHRAIVAVTSPEKAIGSIILDSNGMDNFFVFDNAAMVVEANVAVRFHRSQSVAFFANPTGDILNVADVFMRSAGQWLYWGEGATAVGVRIAIQGEQHGVAIGDDCMISSSVSISNYDMHTLYDVETGEIINASPIDMLIEQHVWVGEGARLLGVDRIGFGSVIAACALVKGTTEPMTMVGGIPAKALRRNASWSRHVQKVEPSTCERLSRLRRFE